MHHPVEFSGLDELTVATLSDLDADTGEATGVVARGETVYASFESLYVATNVWVPAEVAESTVPSRLDEEYSTAIHKFDITGDAAEYRASGSVEGSLLNQFALDEFDGNLRVATTQGAPWGFRDDSESFITVLTEDDGRLVEIGKVGDMGKGERIFAVRFIEDVAYVVTFRQVDPLYVVDLSDPESPTVSGELKIPGYSAYLHPLGEGLILGVGQDADSEGVIQGAKVSLFDVSDPSNPVEVSMWTASGAHTEAEWNHLAFLYWAPTDYMVMPLS
ncbi:MAG: beta-propeller domain-containing protein, partial [Halobacteriales archaeon]|nr:beta-propeller domain-containing protein [Halobacteriales archaeon]